MGVTGGVLRRAGHTEAAIALARLAGRKPAGVICEIMKDDGEMARLPQLAEMAEKSDLKLITIKDLIAYRLEHDSLVQKEVAVDMPTTYGDCNRHDYREATTGDHHML